MVTFCTKWMDKILWILVHMACHILGWSRFSQKMHSIIVHHRQCIVLQGLYVVFQMDWKRYVIVLVKYLQSSLCPEVYPEMSDCTVTMVPYRRLVLSLLL